MLDTPTISSKSANKEQIMTCNKNNIIPQPHPTVWNFKDLTNRQFGRLTVIAYAGTLKPKLAHWWCECECGTIRIVLAMNLLKGTSTSCGCLHKELFSARQKTHGETANGRRTPEYRAYCAAVDRCTNPSNVRVYKRYGGRGIEFRFQSFDEFLAHIGRRPTKKHTLDRINNEGHYEIGNVRWATRQEQVDNRECTNFVTVNNDTLPFAAMARKYNILSSTVRHRVKRGYCMNCAFTLGYHMICPHIQ